MSVKHTKSRALIREEALQEARLDEEQDARAGTRLRTWFRATVSLGIALTLSILLLIPFLAGHSLHDHWEAFGKKILILSGVLLVSFFYAAGTTYNSWDYRRNVKEIHRRFVRPFSK